MAKEMYIGANGGYVVQTIQGDIIPKTWTQVTAGTSYKASDGTKLTASSSSSSSYYANRACDGDTSTEWYSASGTSNWIKLEFPNAVKITKMNMRIGNIGKTASGGVAYIQGSNDNSAWADLYTITTSGVQECVLNNVDYYKYYRVYTEFAKSSSQTYIYYWEVSEYVGTGYDSSIPNIAHKVKKVYIGVDGKARKVKKGYIGVGGVAQQFYSS